MNRYLLFAVFGLAVVVFFKNATAQEKSAQIKFPEPMMVVPQAIVLQNDFSKPEELKKTTWQKRQGTRWSIAGGVLRGIESSPEFQAQKKDHFGYEARLSVPVTPPEFMARFSFRFIDGKETAIVPFIEFGHHVCRIRFSKNGTTLISDGETMKVAEDKKFIWQSGKWYHATAEMKGKEFVIQFVNGPTLYAKRDSFAVAAKNGNGFGVAGPRHGKVEIDNMAIWSIKPEVAESWAISKAAIPEFEPVQIKEPKKKKKRKSS